MPLFQRKQLLVKLFVAMQIMETNKWDKHFTCSFWLHSLKYSNKIIHFFDLWTVIAHMRAQNFCFLPRIFLRKEPILWALWLQKSSHLSGWLSLRSHIFTWHLLALKKKFLECVALTPSSSQYLLFKFYTYIYIYNFIFALYKNPLKTHCISNMWLTVML